VPSTSVKWRWRSRRRGSWLFFPSPSGPRASDLAGAARAAGATGAAPRAGRGGPRAESADEPDLEVLTDTVAEDELDDSEPEPLVPAAIDDEAGEP